MTTFRRGHSAHQQLENNRKLIAKISKTLHDGLTTGIPGATAADAKTLRGIPAIGKGVAGVSPGTRPDQIADDHAA